MQSQRIGPVRRAGRKHPGKRQVQVSPRMHLQHIAARLVKPCDHDDILANHEPIQCRHQVRRDIEPCVWCSLSPLLGGLVSLCEQRVHHPNKREGISDGS